MPGYQKGSKKQRTEWLLWASASTDYDSTQCNESKLKLKKFPLDRGSFRIIQTNAAESSRLSFLRKTANKMGNSDAFQRKLNGRADALEEFLHCDQPHDIQILDLHPAPNLSRAIIEFDRRFLLVRDLGLSQLEVITGHGKRSPNKTATLKPELQKYLLEQNIHSEQTPNNDGSIRVTVPPYDPNTI